MDLAALRGQFPVFERLAYLNTGSVGPLPAAAVTAVEEELRRAVTDGRGAKAHYEHAVALANQLRARIAALLGCDAWEVALTGATTDGINAVLAGLDLRRGDELLTTDEEHPGLLAPLGHARARHGVEVRVVPFGSIAEAIGPRTRLVACSHVSWISGQIVDAAALAATDVPVLLDGAQSLGAVPVDVRELGCDYYAASGQKWLSGPIGSGYLYVREEIIDALAPATPGYGSLADTLRPLELDLVASAARFDTGFAPAERSAWALASLAVLEKAGIEAVQRRAAASAAVLAAALTDNGAMVAERGPSTLVSWEAPDPAAEAARLLEKGLLVRDLPGTPFLRASVGGWTSDEEIERLVAAATSTSSR